jgi:hypothetical protein
MLAAIAVFIHAALCMLQEREPFYTWFYCFAWWSYIICLEAFLHHRGGRSDLFEAPRRFFMLLPLSVCVWLVFEAFNFRLQNWHYLNVPAGTVVRWAGYASSFATVLPGIFTTTRLLEHLGIPVRVQGSRFRSHGWLLWPMVALGMACLILPLVWPRYFFPLIWGAFVFLLEPVNYRLGAPSLLREWESGSLRKFCLLLLAGMWCGFLWELFNFWAGSKWIYTVPYVGSLKVFEMPILGFLGFPPFAVECYVMTNSFFFLDTWVEKNASLETRKRVRILLGVSLALFTVLVFTGIDHFTVVTFGK